MKQSGNLEPRDAGDMRRAVTRSALDELPKGRPALGQTQAYRDKLLKNFDEWLGTRDLSLDTLWKNNLDKKKYFFFWRMLI